MNIPDPIWMELPPVPVPAPVAEALSGSALFQQALVRRGLEQVDAARAFLDPDCYQPSSPHELPDLTRAVGRLQAAIRARERVCVWGDFDVDGQTATTVLVETLRRLGAEVSYHIPVRAKESHGVGLTALDEVIDQGAQVVLTCDTGITAYLAAERARQRRVDFIVTDHHDLGPSLPAAYAVVNPKRLPEGHPLRTLPGVGVAYELAQALADSCGQAEIARDLLDLVALGIVADLAELRGDTRYLLQRGLAALRSTKRLGLRTLFALAELDPARLTEEHIGFIIGPRLNALGRLDDANPVVTFLTTEDSAAARILAAQLEGLNARRRLLCDQVYQAAQAQIERDPSLAEGPALVLANPAWPAGVIGIVASRLVEQYGRPAILLSAPAGEVARGSARSIEGFHITEAIAECASILEGFGGHPMAAGVGLQSERVPEFRRAFLRAAEARLGGQLPPKTLVLDGQVSLADLTLEWVRDLERLAPFGPGNPPLTLLATNLTITKSAPVGRGGEHLQLVVEDEQGRSQKVIWWQGAGQDRPEGRFDLAFTARSSSYSGKPEVQVEWVAFRVREGLRVATRRKRRVEIIDERRAENPASLLRRVEAEGGWQVWGEGGPFTSSLVVGRTRLEPGPGLVIWTAPPGDAELRRVLKAVHPERIWLVAQDPGLDQLEPFLTRLAGLAKFALKNGATVDLNRLSEALAHRPETTWTGLRWLSAAGQIQLGERAAETVEIAAGPGTPVAPVKPVEAELQAYLVETAAYRAYFRQARAEGLF